MTSITIDRADGLSSATAIKGPCRVATTANVTLSGEQTIDGVAVVTNDRVLVKDQTTASDNGIYVADTGPWRRSKDFAGARDVVKGTKVAVTDGSTNADYEYEVTSSNPITIGTSNITFAATSMGLAVPGVVRDTLDVAPYVADRVALKALDPTQDKVAMIWNEGGRNGTFEVRLASSLSAAEQTYMALDTLEGVYVVSTQNALYVWTRRGGWTLAGFDPAWFGGTYNSTAVDNAAAITATARMGRVAVGRGYLYVSTAMTFTNVDLDILGAGITKSEIRFAAGVTTGITATNNLTGYIAGDALSNIRMRGLCYTTEADPASVSRIGIEVTWPEGFGAYRQLPMGSFEHVVFRGVNSETEGWRFDVKLHQCLNVYFNQVYFTGKDEGGAADQTPSKKQRSDTAVYIDGGYAPVEVHFEGCQFYHHKYGIDISGSFEGLYFNNCVMINILRGIRFIPTVYSLAWPGGAGASAVGRPLISVQGSHFNVYERAIDCDGVIEGQIVANCFYHSNWSVQDAQLVTMLNGSDWEIGDNIFRSFSTTNVAAGVIIGTNMGYTTIHDNSFETKGVGIWYQAGGVGNNRQHDNFFKGTYATSSIFNQLNEDAVAHGCRSLLTYLTVAQSIPNNTDTAIVWDTKDHDNFGGYAASSASVTIPSYSGIRRARVSAGIQFVSNATGLRYLTVFKNGAAVPGASYVIANAVTGGLATGLSVVTGALTVAENDVFTLHCLQNSGGALNAQGGGATWMSIEAIE